MLVASHRRRMEWQARLMAETTVAVLGETLSAALDGLQTQDAPVNRVSLSTFLADFGAPGP